MWWIIGIVAYITLLLTGLLFLRGTTSAACPAPQSTRSDPSMTREISRKRLEDGSEMRIPPLEGPGVDLQVGSCLMREDCARITYPHRYDLVGKVPMSGG